MESKYRPKWQFLSVPLAVFFLAIIGSLFISCGGYASQVSLGLGIEGTTDDVSYLSQYGTWIEVAPYGMVWQPSVRSGWQPFTHGHWAWTDDGWAWVSYEPYGWLVFHYGNWDYDPAIGWFWIESPTWSPAPVEWLDYDGYIAWAPLPPAGIAWPNPWDHPRFRIWNMVRDRDFDRGNIGHYRIGKAPLPRDRDRRDVFHRPLGIQDFERITGRNIRPEHIQRGPAPVFMHPPRRENYHERQPFATQHEQRRPEQRHPEQSQPEHRQGQSPPPEQHQGEMGGANNRPHEEHQGEMRGGESRPPENRVPEAGRTENRPPEEPRMENRPGENSQGEMNREKNPNQDENPVQLHRMELPEKDQAKIRKYRPQVEHKVMKSVSHNERQKPRQEKNKNRK